MATKNIFISFNRAPFGSIYYTEGLRAAVGCTAGLDEHNVTIAYLGDGVLFTLKDVDRADSSKYISTLTSMETKFYAEEESLKERNINSSALAEDIEIISRKKVFELLQQADHTISF